MPNNRNVTWFPEPASSADLQRHRWSADIREWLRATTTGARVAAAPLVRGLKSVSPDRWFLVGFVILLLTFLFVLLVQPSSVGRGGR